MSQLTLRGHRHLSVVVPMRGRDPKEEGRAATPLELFFDLVSVVAVAIAAERLHHAVVEGDGLTAVVSYVLVFFGIWWAWVNFTWFASAYDNDDVVFRLTMFVIMTGALVFAAGIPQFFDERDFTLSVLGYVIMRIALVTQWLRVARDDGPRRQAARRFAIGVTACQVGWLALVLVPPIWPIVWLVFAPAELFVPVWAERAARTTYHPEHIAERYGLFMIIVLGESVLAVSLAIQSVLGGDGLTLGLVGVIAGSLLIVYAMWWIYFDRPEEHMLDSLPTAIAWSYVHLPVFAAVAAVGAGLVVAIDEESGHAHLGWVGAGATVAIPLVVYLLSLWALYAGLLRDRFHLVLIPATVGGSIAAVFTPAPVPVMALVLVVMVGVKISRRVRAGSEPA
ncbi:MAG: low temperature requirement protein A [Candidatus Limnocylindria bacterium]